MDIFKSFFGFVFLINVSLVNAAVVNDVVVFNKILQPDDFITWEHDMTRYGYDPINGDDNFTLTIEARDVDDAPGKDPLERPFFMISQGEGRTYGRVFMQDLEFENGSPIYIEGDGVVRPRFTILEGSVWVGSATLTMNIPAAIPLPGTFALFASGLMCFLVKLASKR